MDYKRNRRYFQSNYLVMAVLVIITMLVSLFYFGMNPYIFGVLLVCVAYIYFIITATPKDDEIDRITSMTAKGSNEYIDTISNKLKSFDGTNRPMILSSYYFHDIDDEQHLVKKGKDGKIRSSNYTSSSFTFLDDRFVYNRMLFSIISPALKVLF